MYNMAVTLFHGELRDELKKITDVEAALRFVFRKVQNHWLIRDKNEQFMGAIGLVSLHFGLGSAEFKRLKKAVESERIGKAAILAMQSGVVVDMEATIAAMYAGTEPVIPLNQLWWDAAGSASQTEDEPCRVPS